MMMNEEMVMAIVILMTAWLVSLRRIDDESALLMDDQDRSKQ